MPDRRQAERRDNRRPLLLAGLGLVGVAGVQLLSQKPAPAPGPVSCPAGYHLAGGVCVQDPPPPPPAVDTRPTVTAISGLIVRSGPSTGYRQVGLLPYGAHVTITCQLMGQAIIRSAVWDRLSGPIAGYVSDWYVSTPNVGTFSPGYGVCNGASPPPPGPPPPARPPISNPAQIMAGWIISTSCTLGVADYLVEPTTGWWDTGENQYHRRKRWIHDQATWNKLAVTRSALHIVTPAALDALGNGPDLQFGPILRAAPGWYSEAPRLPAIGAAAGWCN